MLSREAMDNSRGGSTTVEQKEDSCYAYMGYANDCNGAPDGTTCNKCTDDTKKVQYLVPGKSAAPGLTYKNIVVTCGNKQEAACINQVCTVLFDHLFPCDETGPRIVKNQNQ
jgi:hypothetical protein